MRRSAAGVADVQHFWDQVTKCGYTGTLGDLKAILDSPVSKKGRWADAQDEESM
jgi:hypothetical protein